MSRRSVYNALNASSGGKKFPRAWKLDPFKGHVKARSEAFDLLATVLLREITELGYAGGVSILKQFVAECKDEQVRQVIERFETLPGRGAQLDWGECGVITENGVGKKLYAFVFMLGCSRTVI